jgi:hypothetical protein
VVKRLAFVLLLAASSAAADPLDDAQRKIDEIDYEGARDLVAKTLDGGGLSSTELARAHRMAGEIAAALGDAAGAEEHFVAWLVLDPTAQLDEGVSPKIAEPFAAAQARATKLGALDPEITVERLDARALVTLGGKDPLQMIAGMKVEIDGGGTEETRALSIEVSVPDRTTDVTVTVLDARGNVLAVRTATVDVVAGAGPVVETGSGGGRSGGLPAAVRWPTWTVLTAVSAGVGGYFTWQLGNDQDELAAINAEPAQHSFDEAEAARDRGDRHALYANIAFGVAGAAALAAVLTYVLEPDGDVEVAPTASPTGGGLSATLKF